MKALFNDNMWSAGLWEEVNGRSKSTEENALDAREAREDGDCEYE